MHRLWLLSDHSCHTETLCRVFRALHFEVTEGAGQGDNVMASFYTLAVLEMQPKRMQRMLEEFRRRNVASKLLALIPLHADGMEKRLVHSGADDVLAFPVSRARLELTLRNLLRLHMLERAGGTALRLESPGKPDHAAHDSHVA